MVAIALMYFVAVCILLIGFVVKSLRELVDNYIHTVHFHFPFRGLGEGCAWFQMVVLVF